MLKALQQKYWSFVLKKHNCKFLSGPRHLRKNALLTIESHVDLGRVEIVSRDLQIGAHTYIRDGSELLDVSSIGRYCSIGKNVIIGIKGKQHPSDWLSTSLFEQPMFDRYMESLDIPDVRIGNDCWIGRDAIIMSGVTIGDGAIIGTRALVTEDVPPYAIVVGTPAKVLRYRFEDELIQRMQASQWWNLPKAFLRQLDFSDPSSCLKRIETESPGHTSYDKLYVTKTGIVVQ